MVMDTAAKGAKDTGAQVSVQICVDRIRTNKMRCGDSVQATVKGNESSITTESDSNTKQTCHNECHTAPKTNWMLISKKYFVSHYLKLRISLGINKVSILSIKIRFHL